MVVLATPIIDWNAMWKIFVVALAAGAGVVIAFGFVLLGVKIANRSGSTGGGSRLGGYALSAVCGGLCLGVIVVGVYAMTKKPKSKPAAKPKAAALVIPASPPVDTISDA